MIDSFNVHDIKDINFFDKILQIACVRYKWDEIYKICSNIATTLYNLAQTWDGNKELCKDITFRLRFRPE